MSVIDVFCHACKAVRPHASGDNALVCTGCGLVRGADESLLIAALSFAVSPPVVEMADCRWCNETKPVGHVCPAGAVGCLERQGDETPCGQCDRCKDVQRQHLERQAAEFEADPYGSPSDLFRPEETP